MNIHNTQDLRQAIRNGPYAWPGGYPLYFITDDGAALSFEAVKAEYRQVSNAIRHKLNDGWRVIAMDINWEDGNCYCAHMGKQIECAYPSDDNEE